MSPKRADEIYCPSCGALIKKDAVICPECGIENPESDQQVADISQASGGQAHAAGTGSDLDVSTTPDFVTVVSWGAGLFVLLLGLGLLVSAELLPTLVAPFVMLGGLALLPPVRERRTHPLSTVGWVKTVDEETTTAPENPCTRCRKPVTGNGISRTRAEKYVVCGVEAYTSDAKTNVYHPDCLHGTDESTALIEEELEKARSATDG
jgi:hypothetical protein